MSSADSYTVKFAIDDKECPYNFSTTKKWTIVSVMALQCIWVLGLASVCSPANHTIAQDLGVSDLIGRVAMALYLVGLSFGPAILTPIAEDYGRRLTFGACLVLLYLLQIPTALASNITTLMVCRFLAGFVAAPVFNSCCNVPDLWQSMTGLQPSYALNVWAFSIELIVCAPIWGAYINSAYGWRWVFGVSGIVGAGLTALFFAIVPETRHNVLLAKRAARLRKETGDSRYSPATPGHRTFKAIMVETVYRPVFMLSTEPIVYLFALYDGLNYSSTFLVIEAVPLIYARHNIHDPQVNFIFFTVVVGYAIAAGLYYFQWRLEHSLNRKAGEAVPEYKLLWGMVGGVLFPVSLYIFAWVSLPSVYWPITLFPLVIFGIASHSLLMMVSDYTVSSYGHFASSAVTGQSFARELMSAGGIIIGEIFYEGVGYPQASTIIAGLATALGIVPFVVFRYGPIIREKSRFSQEIKRLVAEEAAERNSALASKGIESA